MGRKDAETKNFLIAIRRRTGTGLTSSPVWAMQKKGKRTYNKKAKRHWREVNFAGAYKKAKRKQKKLQNIRYAKSGDRSKRGMKVKREKARHAKRAR